MSPSNELWLGILIAVVNKFQNNQWKNELLNYTEYVQLYMVHNPNAQHHISAMLREFLEDSDRSFIFTKQQIGILIRLWNVCTVHVKH